MRLPAMAVTCFKQGRLSHRGSGWGDRPLPQLEEAMAAQSGCCAEFWTLHPALQAMLLLCRQGLQKDPGHWRLGLSLSLA